MPPASNASYWCHMCETPVVAMMTPDPMCPHCLDTFVEQITPGNEPQAYISYQANHQRPNQGNGPNGGPRQPTTASSPPLAAQAPPYLDFGAINQMLPGVGDALRSALMRTVDPMAAPAMLSGSGVRNTPGAREQHMYINPNGSRTYVSWSSSALPEAWRNHASSRRRSVSYPSIPFHLHPSQHSGGSANEGGDPTRHPPPFSGPGGADEGGGPFSLLRLLQMIGQSTGGTFMPITGPMFATMGGNANGQFGDYVLDANEFDNIISQIMEQQPSNHPLPASEASINNLQQSAVTAADLEETKECSICRDDFNVGENVVRLPCKHFFHDPCIKQWLRTNGTCPICRKRLDNAVGSPDSSSRPGQSSTSHARSSGPGPNHLVTSSNGHSTNSGSGGGGGGGSGGAGQWFPGAGMFFSAASNILSSTLAPAPASSQPPATSQPTTNSNTAPGQPAAATSSNTATSTGAWSTLVPLVSNLLQSLTSPHHASLASIHNLSANPAHSLTSRRSPPSSPPVGRGDHDPLRHLDDDVD